MSWRWRIALCAMWVVVFAIQFGPISSADQGSSGPVQDGIAVAVLIGELLAIGGAAIGWEMTPTVSGATATAALAASAMDIGRVPTVAAAELGMYVIALAVSLEAAHYSHLAALAEGRQSRRSRALDAPGVAGWISGRIRVASLLAAAGVGAIWLFGVIVTRIESKAEWLAQHGAHFDGVVEAASGPTRFSAGSVTVSYRYHGTAYTQRINLNDDSPEYTLHQHVTVDIDPEHPKTATIGGSDNQSGAAVFATIAVLAVGATATGLGLIQIGRLRRSRAVLSHSAWQAATFEYPADLRSNTSTRLMTILVDGRHLARVTLRSKFDATSGEVCGTPPGHLVVRRAGQPQTFLTGKP